RVAVTQTTREPLRTARAMIPAVRYASSSGCAHTPRMFPSSSIIPLAPSSPRGSPDGPVAGAVRGDASYRRGPDAGERPGNRTVLRSHAREGARDASCDRASGAVVPQPFASVVREDDVGMLPAERALVVDRERRPASFVRADPPALEGPGRGGQVAGSGSLVPVPDSTLTGEGFGPPIGRSRGDPGRAPAGSGRVGVGPLEERPEPVDELGRHLVAPALGPQDLLEPPLERGVPAAGVAAAQVVLDLDAHRSDELSIEVELDLLQHMFAVSP